MVRKTTKHYAFAKHGKRKITAHVTIGLYIPNICEFEYLKQRKEIEILKKAIAINERRLLQTYLACKSRHDGVMIRSTILILTASHLA